MPNSSVPAPESITAIENFLSVHTADLTSGAHPKVKVEIRRWITNARVSVSIPEWNDERGVWENDGDRSLHIFWKKLPIKDSYWDKPTVGAKAYQREIAGWINGTLLPMVQGKLIEVIDPELRIESGMYVVELGRGFKLRLGQSDLNKLTAALNAAAVVEDSSYLVEDAEVAYMNI